jgi:hypothetical protein
MTLSAIRFAGPSRNEQFQDYSPTVYARFTSTSEKDNNPNPQIPRYDLDDILAKAREAAERYQVKTKVSIVQELGAYTFYPDGHGGATMGASSVPVDQFRAAIVTSNATPDKHRDSYEFLRRWADTLYPVVNPAGGGDGSSWIA